MKVDFDDSGWPRRRGPILGGYGCARRAGVALVCLRGRFGVSDTGRVKDLKLTLAYRGGAVAYVNGEEVARGHLPQGKLQPLALAEGYPREVFASPSGRSLLRNVYTGKPPANVADRYKARIRKLEAAIPSGLLRKGTNVLAVRLHRTAIPADVRRLRRFRETWNTAGLVGLRLTAAGGSAVVANVGEASGAQVWNADPLVRVGVDVNSADPFEPLRPVELLAPRNGMASGQVVVSAPAGIGGLSARPGDLKAEGGPLIPSSAIRVRYAKLGERFVPLLDAPVDGAKIQPIWLTVKVPAHARAGRYTGELVIRGLAHPVTVPIELTVCGWKVGDPGDWRTCVNLLQSPESVAGYYKVALWSDEHFKLMEKSLELMGECGNDVLGVSAVGKSVFGDDPMIVFRKANGRHVPELKLVERYLRLYDKHAGEPQFLSLNVWSYGMYKNAMTRDGGTEEWRAKVIPVVELRADKLVPVKLPIYGEPGTEELWRQAMDGLRERVKRLGWRQTRILLGTSGDAWPSAITVNMFRRIAPYAQWRVLTHGSGCPKWGMSDHERTQPNGMVVGYLEAARRLYNRRVKLAVHPIACNARDNVGSNPFTYRGLAFVNTITTNYDGFCWKGLDYWAYTTPQGTTRSALNTYVRFGNMVGGTPRAIAAPGPRGAVTTVQLEMLRQGTQECEAALSIRENLKILYPPSVKKHDVVNLTLKGALLQAGSRKDGKIPRISARDLELRLLSDGGELLSNILPWAPTYNTGKHTGTIKALPSKDGLRFDVQVTLGDDRWVEGGQGRWVIQLRRRGDSYTGTFSGSFKGKETKGRVSGVFTPDGFTVPTDTPPVENDLTKRCHAVIEDLSRLFNTGPRVGGCRCGDLRRLVARLYATATEVAEAVRAKQVDSAPRR